MNSRERRTSSVRPRDTPKKRVRPFWTNAYVYYSARRKKTFKKVQALVKKSLPSRPLKPTRLPKTKVLPNRLISPYMRKPRRLPRSYVSPYTRVRTIYGRTYRYYGDLLLPSSPPNEQIVANTWTTTLTGNLLPKWRQVIRGGGTATTSYTLTANSLEAAKYGDITAWYYSRTGPSAPWVLTTSFERCFNNFLGIAPVGLHYTNGADQEAQDRATRELYKRIRSAHHQLQGGVILGEIDKTARMLIGTARNLKSGIVSYLSKAVGIRKGRGSNATKRQAIANSYLEAVFGWQPLIFDCRDFAKTLGRLFHEVDRVRFRVIGEAEKVTSAGSTAVNFSRLWAEVLDLRKTKTTVIYRGFLQGKPNEVGSPSLDRIVTMSGFDLGSFIPTMWELVPYSFVVDYFTNIGDCLYAANTDTSAVRGLWRTQIKESVREIHVQPDVARSIATIKSTLMANVKDITCSKTDGHFTIKLRDITRSVSSFPVMVPKLTGLDLPWKQFANIGALIVGKSGRQNRT